MKSSHDRLFYFGCRICLLMLFCSTSVSPTPAQAQGSGRDIPRVHNPAQAPLQETWQLKEVWRVGGDDDEDLLLGFVSDVIGDERGFVYILDSQMCQVNVISPDGGFVRTLSRKGEGPGEVTLPSSLLRIGDGEIGIVQGYPGKVIKLTDTDVPTGTIMVGECDPGTRGSRITMNAAYRDDRLMILGAKMTFNKGDQTKKTDLYLASFDDQGCEIHRFAEMEEKNEMTKNVWRVNERQNFFPATRWAMGKEGHVFISPDRDCYVIHELGATGELIRIISRDFKAKKRTKEDLNRIKGGYSSNMPDVKYEFNLESYEPAILSIECAPDGKLWVSNCFSSSDLPEGICKRYDLFDPQGRLTKEVSLAMPFDAEEDEFYRLDDRRFVRVTGTRSAGAAMSRAKGFVTGNDTDAELEAVPVEVILYKVVG